MKTFTKKYKVGEIAMAQDKVQEFKDNPVKAVSKVGLSFHGFWTLTIEYEDLSQ